MPTKTKTSHFILIFLLIMSFNEAVSNRSFCFTTNLHFK